MDYRTKISFLGLPLVHIATTKKVEGVYRRGVAKGWIAIGDISIGILLSLGGVAIGGIAVGGLSLGLVSIAGLACGIFALGGVAIGYYAIGGAAIGIYCACGGFAAAFKYAIGGAAIAEQANTHIAEAVLRQSLFFRIGNLIMKHSRWALLLVLLPVILNVKKRFKKEPQSIHGV